MLSQQAYATLSGLTQWHLPMIDASGGSWLHQSLGAGGHGAGGEDEQWTAAPMGAHLLERLQERHTTT